MRLRNLLRRFAVAALALGAAAGAGAGVVNPGYYVVTVYDDPGVVTLAAGQRSSSRNTMLAAWPNSNEIRSRSLNARR